VLTGFIVLFAGLIDQLHSTLARTVFLNKILSSFIWNFFNRRVSVGGGQQGCPVTARRPRHPASGDQLLCNPLGSQVSSSLFSACKKTKKLWIQNHLFSGYGLGKNSDFGGSKSGFGLYLAVFK
jgi:hypothetical protein